MTRRDVQHTPDKLSLKIAAEALIDAVGGATKAQGYCRADKRRLGEYAGPNTDSFMPSDVKVDLERRAMGSAGWPQLTREEARQLGFVLVRVMDAAPRRGDLIGSVGRLSKENGELGGSICAALSDDKFTEAEADEALAIAHRQQETLSALIAQLKALRGEQE